MQICMKPTESQIRRANSPLHKEGGIAMNKKHLFRLQNGYTINRIAKSEYIVLDKHHKYIVVNGHIRRFTMPELLTLARI